MLLTSYARLLLLFEAETRFDVRRTREDFSHTQSIQQTVNWGTLCIYIIFKWKGIKEIFEIYDISKSS